MQGIQEIVKRDDQQTGRPHSMKGQFSSKIILECKKKKTIVCIVITMIMLSNESLCGGHILL